jgi:hypothetical protein
MYMWLGIVPSTAWSVLRADQVTATARLDSGEVVTMDPDPHSEALPREFAANYDFEIIGVGESMAPVFVKLYLLPPRKPCARITSLTGTMRVVLGDLGHLKHSRIIPTTNAQTVSDVPDCDLTIALEADRIDMKFSTDSLRSVHGLQFLDSDGRVVKPYHITYLGAGPKGTSMSIDFQGHPPASIDINWYSHLQAALMDFTLGSGTAQLRRDPGEGPPHPASRS